MPEEQAGFFFEAPLSADVEPASQIVPRKPPPTEDAVFISRAREVIDGMEADDVTMEDVLDAMGIAECSRIGWHRARILDCFLAPITGTHTAYWTEPDRLGKREHRFVRKPPLEPCSDCGEATRGRLCDACRKREEDAINRAEEERLNNE